MKITLILKEHTDVKEKNKYISINFHFIVVSFRQNILRDWKKVSILQNARFKEISNLETLCCERFLKNSSWKN